MIDEFRGKYFFLSNFYSAPVMHDGIMFDNNEAAYQSAKCIDASYRVRFCHLAPSEAKRVGRYTSLRKDWERIKNQVMEDCIRDKFTRNLDLRQLLLETGDEELIERNDWGDIYWGVCHNEGKNMLGKILMKVREELRS